MTPSHEPYGPPVSISEAIERERSELMQVHAMLKCLYEVLLYADDDDSVMHADVANVCARLLSECVVRLDALRLRTLRSDDDADDVLPPEPPQVRDMRAVYLC
jgi:hypothetical protein